MDPVDARSRVLFVIPVFQSVYARPFANFMAMMGYAASREQERYAIDVRVPEREILHSAMNRAAMMALEHGHEAIIVADDDCFPPIDALSKLLRHFENGIDVVAGVGIMRNYPYTTTAGRYYPEGISIVRDGASARLAGFEWVDDIGAEPPGLVPVDFMGFPIALISRRALLKIPPPWFGTNINGGECTHDVFFGTKARAAEISLYVDRDIPCGHLTDPPIIKLQDRSLARKGMELAKRLRADQP